VLILAFSMIFTFLLKIIFNFFAAIQKKDKVPMDKWQVIELFSAGCSVTVVFLIKVTPASLLVNTEYKDYIDYAMSALVVVQFMRFFLFFLVINSVSKMLLTLIYMVLDTVAFTALHSTYLVIMSSVFTTFFQDQAPSVYGNINITLRMMFENTAASYSYQGMGDMEYVHIVVMALNVFIGNILLLNYLVAIMSTTYGLMLESGSFLFKVNLYNYCERYMIGFKNLAYGELVFHPAPISVLVSPVVLLCFMLPSELMEKVSIGFSYTMHWLENLIFLCLFFVYEILLVPLVYFKNFVIIIWASMGLFTTIFNAIFWIFGGIPLSIYIALRDVYYLFLILTMH
jgi:hypothetical protein